eukprot:603956-Karenia_brevis.AAC.1
MAVAEPISSTSSTSTSNDSKTYVLPTMAVAEPSSTFSTSTPDSKTYVLPSRAVARTNFKENNDMSQQLSFPLLVPTNANQGSSKVDKDTEWISTPLQEIPISSNTNQAITEYCIVDTKT